MSEKHTSYSLWIVLLSVLIPLSIMFLYNMEKIEGRDFSFLPTTYAMTNGLTSLCLILGVIAIKNGKMNTHKALMTTAIILSIYFLAAYVIYHATTEETKYGGEGWDRYIYFFILITHILLSLVTVPLVLITYTRALAKRFDKHKRIARITFPIWLYVSLTGVIIYLMISPYYT